MTAIIQQADHPVVRPLHILVPLIRLDLKEGLAAEKHAGMPYYRAAGGKMIEAKAQLKHGEFVDWVKRNFKIGKRQAAEYMNIARATRDIEKGSALPFTTLRDAVHATRSNPNYGKGAAWEEPVREALNQVDLGLLRRQALHEQEERDARREIALQLINIGYKVLASKLHPDKKGGSREAMARLNRVRDALKQSIQGGLHDR